MNKADKQESDRRVRQVSEWLLDGESTYKIVQYCTENWGIEESQSRVYIRKARKLWEEIYHDEIENNLRWHLIARRKLFNKCIKDGDKTNARQLLNDIADIQGISRNRIEHTGKDGGEILIREIVVNRETANTDKE